MAITVQNVIDGGYSKSAASRPGTIAAPAELISRIRFCLLETFQVIARENPYMIAISAAVPFADGGWQRPANCIRAIGLRILADTIIAPAVATGTKLTIVPYEDQGFGAGDPCLTELGQMFIPTGQAIDPSGGPLTLVFARTPTLPTTTASVIDSFFPEAFIDLLNYDIAVFLADKDKRTEDSATFTAMKSALLALVIQWTHGQTYELVQRFPITTPPLTKERGGSDE